MSEITIQINDEDIEEKLKKTYDSFVHSYMQDYFQNPNVRNKIRDEIQVRIKSRTDKVIFDALEKIDISAKVEEAIDMIIAKRAETLFKARMKAAE